MPTPRAPLPSNSVQATTYIPQTLWEVASLTLNTISIQTGPCGASAIPCQTRSITTFPLYSPALEITVTGMAGLSAGTPQLRLTLTIAIRTATATRSHRTFKARLVESPTCCRARHRALRHPNRLKAKPHLPSRFPLLLSSSDRESWLFRRHLLPRHCRR